MSTILASTIAPSTTGNGVTTAGIDTTGADLIVLAVSWYLLGASLTVSDSKGNTWTPLTTRGIWNQATRIYYCSAPTAGAGHTFTVAGTGTYPVLGAVAVSGVAGPQESESGAYVASDTSLQPGSLTPSVDGSLIVSSLDVASGNTMTANSGLTVISSDYTGQAVGGALGYLLQTPAAAINPTWSWLGGALEAATALAVFPPAGGGAATTATLSGPTTGMVGVASTNFAVSLNGTYTGTITPASTGAGTFSPTSLTWTGTSGSQTFTYTPSSTAGSPHSVSISASPLLTPAGSPIAYTVTPADITVDVTDTHLYFSPGNWYSDGAGSYQANNIKGSSTYALSNNPGAYLKIALTSTGSGSLTLDLDTSILSGISGGNTPVLSWNVDGGVIQTQQLAYSASPVTQSLATGLAGGSHTAQVWFRAVDLTGNLTMGDRWNDPTTGFSGIKITGITLDGGSTLASPTLRPKTALWFSASDLEGANNVGDLTATGQDARRSYGLYAAEGLDAELGLIGWSAQGYEQAGYGNVPTFYSSTQSASAWPYFFSGASRTGLTPDYVICSHGINGGALAVDVHAWIGQVRATWSAAQILVCVPWNQAAVATLTSGVNAYLAANPSDTKVHLIDPGTNYGASVLFAATGNHPNTEGDAIVAARYAGLMRAAFVGGATSFWING